MGSQLGGRNFILTFSKFLDENFEVECPVEVDDGEEEMTEIRFVPEDESVLDAMYKAVQECSLLHPDPSSDLSSNCGKPYLH